MASPDHLKQRLRKKGKIRLFFQSVFSGLFYPFCPGCNENHPDWTQVGGKPWFCIRCFDLKQEAISPWTHYPWTLM